MKDENTSIQVKRSTHKELKELKHSFKVESLEDVIKIILKSRNDVETQVIYARKKIRNICDKDESLWTNFEDVDDMLANCLNIIDNDLYELEKGNE